MPDENLPMDFEAELHEALRRLDAALEEAARHDAHYLVSARFGMQGSTDVRSLEPVILRPGSITLLARLHGHMPAHGPEPVNQAAFATPSSQVVAGYSVARAVRPLR